MSAREVYLAFFLISTFIDPHVGEKMEVQEQLQDVQHENHLGQDQHPAPFRLQLLQQDSQSF